MLLLCSGLQWDQNAPERRSGSFLYKNSFQQCIRKCYLNSGGLQKPDDLAELQAAVETIPVTSAEAERGFSTMNIIASPIRNQLSVERLSKLMFASLIGPPLESAGKKLSASGGFAPLTRCCAPGPRWGLRPQTPDICAGVPVLFLLGLQPCVGTRKTLQLTTTMDILLPKRTVNTQKCNVNFPKINE